MSEQRLIDANEAIKILNHEAEVCNSGFTRGILELVAVRVETLKTIEAEPVRHGRWEEKFFTNDRQRVCSVCHCTVRQPSYDKGETALFKYCPHCGAKMDGGADNG